MKLLIVSPFFPYSKVPHAGGKFTFEIIKELSKKHDIHLLSRIEPEQVCHKHEMEAFCSKIDLYSFKTPDEIGVLTIFKIIISYLYLGIKANRLIKNQGYDLVHVEHTQAGLLIKKTRHIPSVLMAHDVVTKPAERKYLSSRNIVQKMLNKLFLNVTKIIETYISGKFDVIFTLSNKDKQVLLKLNKKFKTAVIPYPLTDIPLSESSERNENTILFCGAMNRSVNIEAVKYFVNKVFPLIQKKIPDSKFYIVGNNPGPDIYRLAQENANILVTGFVDDIKPYYLNNSVFVSPLFTGGGIIVKNLQAMAYGIPVVTTTIGNEGIEAEAEKEVIIANDPVEFANKVLALLRDAEYQKRIASNAKNLILKNFTIEAVIKKIESNYKLLL